MQTAARMIREEAPVLDDKYKDPVVRTSLRAPRSVIQRAAAIGDATGNSLNDVIALWLKLGNERWLEQATPDQRERYAKALAVIENSAGSEPDEGAPRAQKRPTKKQR